MEVRNHTTTVVQRAGATICLTQEEVITLLSIIGHIEGLHSIKTRAFISRLYRALEGERVYSETYNPFETVPKIVR